MADVSHELGALRFVVDSSLSSKVAMFNNQVNQHKQAQSLNPFSQADGRASPKPTFSKEEYGKPLAGSLTEMRGQKANIHVLKEMLELCQIIDSEGYVVNDEPTMRVIPFGELFNIYNYISDKVVGILLRARKYKLVQFEGEMLFQRRDDDVPVFLLRPIAEIRKDLDGRVAEIKRASSPAPLATTLLLDKGAHKQKLQESGLSTPISRGGSKSRTPSLKSSPAQSKAATPKAGSPEPAAPRAARTAVVPTPAAVEAALVAAALVPMPQILVQTEEQLLAAATPAPASVVTLQAQPEVETAVPAVTPKEQQQGTQTDKIEKKDQNNNTSAAAVTVEATAVYVRQLPVTESEDTIVAPAAAEPAV